MFLLAPTLSTGSCRGEKVLVDVALDIVFPVHLEIGIWLGPKRKSDAQKSNLKDKL